MALPGDDVTNPPRQELTEKGETKVTTDADARELLQAILSQLKLMNAHLTVMSGQNITEEDVT